MARKLSGGNHHRGFADGKDNNKESWSHSLISQALKSFKLEKKRHTCTSHTEVAFKHFNQSNDNKYWTRLFSIMGCSLPPSSCLCLRRFFSPLARSSLRWSKKRQIERARTSWYSFNCQFWSCGTKKSVFNRPLSLCLYRWRDGNNWCKSNAPSAFYYIVVALGTLDLHPLLPSHHL